MITEITTHENDAIDRLITQYSDSTNLQQLIKVYTTQIQEIETVFFDLLNSRTINNSSGQQLDNIGTLIDQDRLGYDDTTYLGLIYNKISQINSEGTIENLISIFNILMNADKITLSEPSTAHVNLYAINSSPLISNNDINIAISNSKPTGVSVDLINVQSDYFGFQNDSEALGFSSLTDATQGGYLSDLFTNN